MLRIEILMERSNQKPPKKPKNAERREREYLTPQEIILLIEAAASVGRHSTRDAALILMAYKHGLRPGEIVNLAWLNIDMQARTIRVIRLKNGRPSAHELDDDELEVLRKLQLEYIGSEFIFCSERKGPLTKRAVHTIIARAAQLAGIEFTVHPHMLRHSKGHQLAANGADSRLIQDYFGHRNIGSAGFYRSERPIKNNRSSEVEEL
jgi:type 1 fimbriae regulatory protein FimE